MITTATERLTVMTWFNGSSARSGIFHCGRPGFTASNVLIPHSSIGRTTVSTAPAAIRTTTIGNFGATFFTVSKIASEMSPSISEGKLIRPAVSWICSKSSGSSPVPAVPPSNLGTCIRMIVIQIPLMNPPITGAEM